MYIVCTAIGDPVIRGVGFKPTTSLCLSQARILISIIIRCGLFMFNNLTCDVIVRFVNIGGILDHHCLNFLFIHYYSIHAIFILLHAIQYMF